MSQAGWCVVQVQTGKERKACELIERVCSKASNAAKGDKPLVEECFCPHYEYRRKRHGEWRMETLPLLPGYVIAVTHDSWQLAHELRKVREFTRVLAMGETFSPLKEDERSWIDKWTKEGNRTIPMSVAYKEGDKVVVSDGPLVGHEAMITRVNRRNRVAHLEIHVGQMTIHTTVGLEVLPKQALE